MALTHHEIQIATPSGPAQVQLDLPGTGRPGCLLVLGHGAAGGVDAPDLIAVRHAVVPAGVAVARVTQPYRLAGRRAPAPAASLDAAWIAVVQALRERPELERVPVVTGGRSSGARVACRTAVQVGAAAVIALAFPLRTPGRPDRPDRAGELPTSIPTLVINGDRDPFGTPVAAGPVEVILRQGERHDLRRDPAAIGLLVRDWLAARGLTGG
jgi:predicted alpha/beta-hydrolase family hydrolase